MDDTKIINKGSAILEENNFFKDLIKLMKDNSFREFYNEYFTDWSDIQIMIFYMKLYSVIEQEYLSRFSVTICDEVMSWALYTIMSDQESRQTALKLFKNYKGDFLEIDVAETTQFRQQIAFK